jgi:PAS domain S-box-containing protein
MKLEDGAPGHVFQLAGQPRALRHLVEDLPVGIYLVDQDRPIRFWNHAAEHLAGRLCHEVMGRVLEDAVQPATGGAAA